MTIHQVKEFHDAFGVETPSKPTISTEERRVLRVKLIAEELMELCEASGVYLWLDTTSTGGMQVGESLKVPDLVEIADALTDLQYVVLGSCLEYGLPQQLIFDEVHSSNLSKLGKDGKPIYREDGKVLKGPSFYRPDIKSIIDSIGDEQ